MRCPGCVEVTLQPIRRTELERLAEDNGFGLPDGASQGWLAFKARAHPGVGAELVRDTAPAAEDRRQLGLAALPLLEGLRPAHLRYLAFHREHAFRRQPPSGT